MQLKAMDTLKRISEKHESEDVLFSVLDFFVFFSLIFTDFLPNQRKADSNNGNLFVSFPRTVKNRRLKKKKTKKGLVPTLFFGGPALGALPIFRRRREDVTT